ncbi:MAG: PAS domain-containing protein, partial [Candidatus Saccharimonadales bacterium]
MRDRNSSLDESNERYQAFIRNSSEGIWRFELDVPVSIKLSVKKQIQLIFDHAYLAEANQAFADMYDVDDLETLIGTKLADFMPSNDPENIAYIKAFIQNNYSLSGIESHEVTPSGEDRYIRNSLVGIIENDMVTRAWGTQMDVTEQRQATDELTRSQERLSLALQSSSMGLWEWDTVANKLFWSDELKVLYGLKPEDEITMEKYQDLIHPNDREITKQIIYQHMQSGNTYQFEHRILWENGEVHWMLSKGRAYFEAGKVIRMIGTGMNIDEAKQADELEDAYNLL